jgi:AraC family transcriptional regulator of arabinose operon
MARLTIDTRPLLPAPIITGADTMALRSAFRRPQGLPDYVLIFTVAGDARVGSASQPLAQRAGDILLVEPHHSLDQATGSRQPWRRIWCIFSPRPHWYDWLDWPVVTPGYRQLHLPDARRSAPVRASLEAMHHHANRAGRLRGELALNALEAALLWCDDHNPRSARAKLDPRIRRALDYIDRALAEPLTLAVLARVAGLSQPQLTRLFRHHLGLSPMQFVERQRLQRACQLLALTAQPIGAIAHQVGYEDAFYFSTRFRRATGVSPRAYRTQQ